VRRRLATRLAERIDRSGERGSALIEFTMMSVLLVFVLFGVLQVAALVFVRSIVASAASEGAHYAGGVGVDPGDGGARAAELIRQAFGSKAATRVHCSGRSAADPATSVRTATVVCDGRITSIFLPIGALVELHVHAESFAEP
jgi:TadE-like protein